MKTKMTIDTEGRNNFHNAGPISVRIDMENTVEWNGDELVLLTPSQAKRIERHFCGMSDCCCGSGPLIQVNWDEYAIHPNVLKVS